MLGLSFMPIPGFEPRRYPGVCVAYIADPSPAGGTGTLFRQKRAIDGYARDRKLCIDAYFLDSGSALTPVGIAHGLHRLLCAVRDADVRTVLVEHVSRFAEDDAVSLRIAASMSSWGAVVREARGELALIEPDLASRLPVGLPRGSRDRLDLAHVVSRYPRRAFAMCRRSDPGRTS